MWQLIILIIVIVLFSIISKANKAKKVKKSTIRNRQDSSIVPGVFVEKGHGASFQISIRPSHIHYSRQDQVDPDEVWIPAGRSVEVAGYAIDRGMLYVGDYLQSVGGSADPDPALIIPSLEVDRARPDIDGAGMNYWPSYSDISPASRAGYLGWLSSGRSDPTAYIGYVFLYFYGLERRALADVVTSASARAEIEAIRGELERLLSIYHDNSSFNRYASDLIDVLRLRQSSCLYKLEPPQAQTGFALPISLRVALGQLSMEGKPIPADWAFAWATLHPEVHLRTPAKRCPDEFKRLFNIYYSQLYGDGLKVAPNKKQIAFEYQPASRSLSRNVNVLLGNIPDVSILTGPLNKLVEIVDRCSTELEPFSRFMRLADADRQGITAAALLPQALARESMNSDALKLKDWVDGQSQGRDIFEVQGMDLIGYWPDKNKSDLDIKETTLLAQLLERMSYGIEPDPRFGGPALKAGEKVVLFCDGPDSPKAPSQRYKASTALLHVGAVIANADMTIAESEREFLLSHIESAMDLVPGERKRLHAHFLWLINSIHGFSGLKRRIGNLASPQKKALAQFALGVIGADGRIEPAEVKALTKIYPLLGFLADDVYADLHAMMTMPSPAAEEPVTIQVASSNDAGYSLPAIEKAKQEIKHGVILDMKAVHAKIKETAEVSALLSTIFNEEASANPGSHLANILQIGTLDPVHSQLLRVLIGKGEVSRSEYEREAASLGLMPDGALEEINDAAFEACNRPIFEGEDPIQVVGEVAKEMMA